MAGGFAFLGCRVLLCRSPKGVSGSEEFFEFFCHGMVVELLTIPILWRPNKTSWNGIRAASSLDFFLFLCYRLSGIFNDCMAMDLPQRGFRDELVGKAGSGLPYGFFPFFQVGLEQ